MRKQRSLKRLPKHLQSRVAACDPASDSDFCKAGVSYEALEFLSINDETRRGLAAVLSLKSPIESLRTAYPEIAEKLKQDAITIGRWVDGCLQRSVRSVEEVQFMRNLAAAKRSPSYTVSAALIKRYAQAFS